MFLDGSRAGVHHLATRGTIEPPGQNVQTPWKSPRLLISNRYPPLNAISGAKWPVYLTIYYNDSLIKTYDLAKDSSVVNDSIEPGRTDMIHQVQQVFLPLWGNRNISKWQPDNTLFAIFVGNNDVDIALGLRANLAVTFDGLMATYSLLVDQVSRETPLFLSFCQRSVSSIELARETSYS